MIFLHGIRGPLSCSDGAALRRENSVAGNYTGELHPDIQHSGSALLKAIYFHINWFSNTGVLLDTAFPHHPEG